MNDNNGRGLFIFVFLGIPGLYIGWLLMPFVIFYVLPFALVTALFGFLWERFSRTEPHNLVILIPLSLFILVWTVGFPQKTLFSPKGTQYLQSPFLYHLYQNVDHWFLIPINAVRKFFTASAIEENRSIYDLRDLSLTLWGALLIGAPGLCGYLANKKHKTAIEQLETKYEGIVEVEKKKAYEQKTVLWNEARELKQQIEAKDEEIAKLKAVAQFLKKDEQASSESANVAEVIPAATKNLKDFLS